VSFYKRVAFWGKGRGCLACACIDQILLYKHDVYKHIQACIYEPAIMLKMIISDFFFVIFLF